MGRDLIRFRGASSFEDVEPVFAGGGSKVKGVLQCASVNWYPNRCVVQYSFSKVQSDERIANKKKHSPKKV